MGTVVVVVGAVWLLACALYDLAGLAIRLLIALAIVALVLSIAIGRPLGRGVTGRSTSGTGR